MKREISKRCSMSFPSVGRKPEVVSLAIQSLTLETAWSSMVNGHKRRDFAGCAIAIPVTRER